MGLRDRRSQRLGLGLAVRGLDVVDLLARRPDPLIGRDEQGVRLTCQLAGPAVPLLGFPAPGRKRANAERAQDDDTGTQEQQPDQPARAAALVSLSRRPGLS